jgi:hypothetical protein
MKLDFVITMYVVLGTAIASVIGTLASIHYF